MGVNFAPIWEGGMHDVKYVPFDYIQICMFSNVAKKYYCCL